MHVRPVLLCTLIALVCATDAYIPRARSSSTALFARERRELLSDGHDHSDEHGDDEHPTEPSVSFLTLFEQRPEESPADVLFQELGVGGATFLLEDIVRLLEVVNTGDGVVDKEGHDHEEEHENVDHEDHDEDEGHDANEDHDENDDHDEDQEEEELHSEGENESNVRFSLTADDLMEQFGTDEGLTPGELEDSCMTILACQVHHNCELGETAELQGGTQDDDDDDLLVVKIIVLFALFLEAMASLTVQYWSHLLSINIDAWLSILNTFSAGVILATGLIHIVPEALAEEEEVDGLNEYPLGMAMATTGFMLVFFIERVLFRHQHQHSQGTPISFALTPANSCATLLDTKSTDNAEANQVVELNDLKCNRDPNDNSNNVGGKPEQVRKNSLLEGLSSIQDALLLLVAFSAHGVLEGIILGLQDEKSSFWALFASVASHKFPAAVAVLSRFMRENASFMQTLGGITAFALIAPVGIAIGLALDELPALVSVIIQGLAAGTFIYIGAYEITHEEFGDGDKSHSSNGGCSRNDQFSPREWTFLKFFAMLAGVAVIAGIAAIPHDHDHGHSDHLHE